MPSDLAAALMTQVTPMTTRVALIEWMEDTTDPKKTIYGQPTDAERCVQMLRVAYRRREVRTDAELHTDA